jgi:hypothetical protein
MCDACEVLRAVGAVLLQGRPGAVYSRKLSGTELRTKVGLHDQEGQVKKKNQRDREPVDCKGKEIKKV